MCGLVKGRERREGGDGGKGREREIDEGGKGRKIGRCEEIFCRGNWKEGRER